MNRMIIGEKGIGKTEYAKKIVLENVCIQKTGCGTCERCQAYLNGNYPDFHYLSGGKIEEVKEILYQISEVPYYDKQIVVFDDMHKMTSLVQNVILKPLEENNGRVIFILIARNSGQILPTIRSRVVQEVIKPMGKKEVVEILKTKSDDDKLISKAYRFGQGNIGSSLEYLKRSELFEMLSEDLKNIKEKNFFEIAQRYTKNYEDDFELIVEYYQKYLYEMIKLNPANQSYQKAFEMIIAFKERLIQNVSKAMSIQNIVLEIQKA